MNEMRIDRTGERERNWTMKIKTYQSETSSTALFYIRAAGSEPDVGRCEELLVLRIDKYCGEAETENNPIGGGNLWP